jgi:hypothetical protein
MNKKISFSGILLILAMTAGCTLGQKPAQAAPTLDVGMVATYAEQTLAAQQTLQAQLNPPTPIATEVPTATPAPTETPTEMPTIAPPEKTEEFTATPGATETPIATGTVMTTPEATAMYPTATEVPATGAKLHVTEDTNCRAGPSPAYRIEGYITPDLTLDVYGVSGDGYWYFVNNPTYPDYHCWVWKWTSVVDGDLGNAPIFRDAWTPTHGTPIVTAEIIRWTAKLEGDCPISEIVGGVITSNTAGTYKYQWITDTGQIGENGFVTLAADTSAVVTTSIRVERSSDRYVRLFVISPVDVKTSKTWFHVKCTAP